MPFDINMNTKDIKVNVFFSKTVELIAAVQLLADHKHHQFAKGWTKEMHNLLSVESKEFLKIVALMPIQGLEFLEFILTSKIYDDTETLLQIILTWEDIDFIYKTLGEELKKKEIEELRKERKKLSTIKTNKPWLAKGSFSGVEKIIYETQWFKETLIQLLAEVDNEVFNHCIKGNTTLYQDAIGRVNEKLLKLTPLDTAQEIMGKKFHRVYNFKDFTFIPSYFISPHNIRTFNKEAQLLVFDPRRDDLWQYQKGETLASALKILSDRTRMEILRQLILGPTYGKILASRLDLTTATISHHLEQLKSMHLINEERVKNIKYFSANVKEIDQLLTNLKEYLYNS